MTELMVIEPEYGSVARRIRASLSKRGAEDIAVFNAPMLESTEGKCDILVISADKSQSYSCGASRCGIMLLPAGRAAPFGARSVVTYGMSPKSTLTFSSIGKDSCVLALLREIVTAGGDVLDRQELKIRALCRADDLLAVSGALLLLGFMPD